MMPVPTHLIDSVRPKDPTIDETSLDAEVVCGCGGRKFELLYPCESPDCGEESEPSAVEIDGNYFFLVKARCVACRKEHLLFDKDYHGWDGFVCHDQAQASLPRPPLKTWTCLKCGKTAHEASVQIETQGRQDFVEETGGAFDENRWMDGFSWFTMSIKCAGCRKRTTEWISYETM